MTNWDTITADDCRLHELIPDICEGCRDYAYCHRQLTLITTVKDLDADWDALGRMLGGDSDD